MGTAIETRDVLAKLDGVIRAHPNGLNGKCLLYVRDKDKVTKDAVKDALAKTKELRFRKMKRTRG